MKGEGKMIKKFCKYYKPHMKLFLTDMFCAFLVSLCNMFYPIIARSIINDYVPNKKIRLLIFWCICLLIIYLIKAGLNYFIQYWGHIVGVRIQGDLYMMAHLILTNELVYDMTDIFVPAKLSHDL